MNIKPIDGRVKKDKIKGDEYFFTYKVSFKINEELFKKHFLVNKTIFINQNEFIELLKDIKPNEI